MEAFLISTGTVALAEMGDKTQLLALVLATRFKKPWPIVAGILAATLLNHALAGLAGIWAAGLLTSDWLRWVIGGSFIAMAAWTLIPDKYDENQKLSRWGAFITTLVAFFFAEMGDKTQIATVALAAKFHDIFAVVMGTVIGLMLANVPCVFLGEGIVKRVPLSIVRPVAAGIFLILGLLTLFEIGGLF